MNKYNIFLCLFIISVVSGVMLLVFYLQAVFGIVANAHDYSEHRTDGFEVIAQIFNPALLISLVAAILSGLAYRIYGIILVAKNKQVSDGEKALWIVGMIIMGFITAIVFLVMAKGRKFTD